MTRLKDFRDFDYGQLDPGIRRLVRWLHDSGYATSDSGDGVTKFDAVDKARVRFEAAAHAETPITADVERLQVEWNAAVDLTNCSIRAAHVAIHCSKSRMVAISDDLRDLLEGLDISVKPLSADEDDDSPRIEATYDPSTHHALIMLWNVDDDMLPPWVGEDRP